MALQSTAKLHPPLSSTEFVSLGLPFFTSSPATNITTPLAAALANRPTCLEGVKPARLHSVNVPPSFQSQNICGNPYACDRLDPHLFPNAAFPWETTSKAFSSHNPSGGDHFRTDPRPFHNAALPLDSTSRAFWSLNPSGGDHYKTGVHADTPATHLSRSGLEYFPSPPSLRTTSQMHSHAPQGTAREPEVVQPPQCSKVCATGGGASQFPTKPITSQTTQASYFSTLDAQPLSATGSSLSKLPQDPVNHSYAFPQQAVSTGLACNPDVAVRTRNNDGFTGLKSAAMHGLRGSLADLPVNSADEASADRGELNQISSRTTAESFTYLNYKRCTASDSQVQLDLCCPSTRCFATRAATHHQQECAANARSRPCGEEAQPQVQIGGTQVSQRTRQAYADPFVTSTYPSEILPDADRTKEGRKDRPPQLGKSDGMYSRESTSSTASPPTSEVRKSAAGASLKLNFDRTSSGTNTTEACNGTGDKEPDAEQDRAREPASRTILCLGSNRSESNKLLENPTIESQMLYSRHISLPVSSFAIPPIRQHTSCGEALQRPLQASQGPNSALINRLGQTDQPRHSAQSRQDLLDEDQSKYTGNSLSQSLPPSNYQVPSLQLSTQPVSADLRRPTVDGTASMEQPQAAGDNTNLLSVRHTNIPQRPSCVNRIQSGESDISSNCTPLAPRHNSGINSSRPPTATPLESGHTRMANTNAYSTIKGPAIDQLPFLSEWRDPSNTEATQHSANGDYFHKKGSPARTKDLRWNCGVLRPVFKRTVHRGQISAVGRPDWRVREQNRNRVVLERIASAGVTAAAATAAGTLLATSSPAIAGLAVAGVAALLTGLAAARTAADTPQCYRRQRARQAPAALHSTSSRLANQSKQHTPQGAWPRDKGYTTAWSHNRMHGLGEVTSQQASQLASELLWMRGYGITAQSPGSNSRNWDPHHSGVVKHLPKPELLAVKPYGTEPCSGTLMLVGRPMEAVLGLKR